MLFTSNETNLSTKLVMDRGNRVHCQASTMWLWFQNCSVGYQPTSSVVMRRKFLELSTLLSKDDICKYSFTDGSVKLRNSLPVHVIGAESVNSSNLSRPPGGYNPHPSFHATPPTIWSSKGVIRGCLRGVFMWSWWEGWHEPIYLLYETNNAHNLVI